MTESYSYIKNAKIIDSSLLGAKYADILIKKDENGSKIINIGNVDLPKGAKIAVYDAKGAFACPGFVDLRAHLCAEGAKPDFDAVLNAAKAGGYSHVVISPDNAGDKDLSDCLKRSFGGVSIYTLEKLSGIPLNESRLQTAAGFYDSGETDTKTLREAMRVCAQNGQTLFVRCRDLSLHGGVMNEGERARQLNVSQIPSLCEELALARYLMLAKDTGCRIHVHAVTTKGSVDMIRQAKRDGVLVTCDTCPQYFSLSDDQLLFKGNAAKVDPPLRSIEDVSAVIQGLADNTVDCISTDHTPCASIPKRRSVKDAPFGMIMLETAFIIGITNLVEKGYLSIYRLIDAMCYAPLRVLGKEPDDTANINLFSLSLETYAAKTSFMGGYSNSPFEGWHFSGKLIKSFECRW